MVISNFNFKNLLKVSALGIGIFAAQSFSYASQANPMPPLVMQNNLLGLHSPAGTITVSTGGTRFDSNSTSALVIMAAYYDACPDNNQQGFQTVNGAITWVKGSHYNLMAASVYDNLSAIPGIAMGSVRSVLLQPFTAGFGLSVFTVPLPCFNVRCSGGLCSGTDTQTVTLAADQA